MIETITIEKMGYGAAAVSHLADGMAVFVDGGAPGDVANVELIEKKKHYAIARITHLREPGNARLANPSIPCPLAQWSFGESSAIEPTASAPACGGCPWAHLSYATQLEAKRANVVEALIRNGRIERSRAEALTAACIPSKHDWGYRNKLELGCGRDKSSRLVLGLRESATNKLSPISACPLANKHISKLPKALQGALRFACGSNDLGIFRVGVRGSTRTHDVEVALWTEPGPFPRNEVSRIIKSACKVSSIVRVMAQPGKERKIKGVESLGGKGAWEEELRWGTEKHEHARFLTSAPSFFQVNTPQAEQLIACALSALQHDGFSLDGAYVADLYSGGGTFSIPLARAGADVIAIEAASTSVRDLRRNAEMNHEYIEVIGGDAGRELADIGQLDALVVDPPRAGLSTQAVENILSAQPARIAYVSCDPQTLSRDVALFEQNGYRLQSAQPVDLFPQTYHVETAALLIQCAHGRI